MAADGRAYGGRHCASPGSKAKAHRLQDGTRIGVVSAVIGMPERFIAWMNEGGDPKAWGEGAPDLRALIVRPNGEVFLAEDSVWFSGPIKTDCYAIGSGGDFALGAMAAGKTAAEAVALACDLDQHCGPPIIILEP